MSSNQVTNEARRLEWQELINFYVYDAVSTYHL